MVVVLKKWDSVQHWLANIELAMEVIPALSLAASALTVCSVDTKHTSMIFPKIFRMRFFQYEQTVVILHSPASIIWMNIIEHIAKFWKARNIAM